MNNEWDELYKQLESTIRGYKRPADWQTRLERVKKRPYKPAFDSKKGANHD